MSDLPRLQARLAVGFGVLAGVVWLLLIFGSTVRVHDAGLSCPDWPLCTGRIVPVFDFRIVLEWGHRLLAGTVSTVFCIGAAILLYVREFRGRFGPHVAAMFGVLACQIVLGGLTVLQLLAFWSVTLHLLFGNAFMALSIALFRRLRGGLLAPGPLPAGVAGAGLLLGGAVALQLTLGGLVSSNHAGLACTEYPACNGGVWFPTFTGIVGLQVFHRLGASALVVAAAGFAWVARADRKAAAGANGILGLVCLQIALGVTNVLTAMPAGLAIAHAATAHAIVGATAFTLTGILARVRAPESAFVAGMSQVSA